MSSNTKDPLQEYVGRRVRAHGLANTPALNNCYGRVLKIDPQERAHGLANTPALNNCYGRVLKIDPQDSAVAGAERRLNVNFPAYSSGACVRIKPTNVIVIPDSEPLHPGEALDVLKCEVLAKSFYRSLGEDLFPPEDTEQVFGVCMADKGADDWNSQLEHIGNGNLAYQLWRGFFIKGNITEKELLQTLLKNEIPSLFEMKIKEQAKTPTSGYIAEVFKRGFGGFRFVSPQEALTREIRGFAASATRT